MKYFFGMAHIGGRQHILLSLLTRYVMTQPAQQQQQQKGFNPQGNNKSDQNRDSNPDKRSGQQGSTPGQMGSGYDSNKKSARPDAARDEADESDKA